MKQIDSTLPYCIPSLWQRKIFSGNDVSYEVQRLKQHMNEPLDSLFVVFRSFEDTASFNIDYRINAADLPDEATGTLNIVVTRSSEG